MRVDSVLLTDICEAADRVAEFIAGMDRDQFLQDRKSQAAVMHEVTIMGEAATQLSVAFKATHPEVAWTDLIRLRNLYIHVYHRINYRRVWRTATTVVPAIAVQIQNLLVPPDTAD